MSEPQPEPRGMTLTDVMTLTLGVAIALGIHQLRDRSSGFALGIISTRAMLYYFATLAVWAAATGVTTVAVARSARFRRSVNSGEWLALILTTQGVALSSLDLRRLSLPYESMLMDVNHWQSSSARWTIAGIWSVLLGMAALTLIPLQRPRCYWIQAILGLSLITLAVQAPLATLYDQGPFLIGLNGFTTDPPIEFLELEITGFVCRTPLGLLFAFFSAATLETIHGCRPRPWTAWAGPVLAWPMFLGYLLLAPTFLEFGYPLWLVNQGFRLAWTAGEWWVAWRILRWSNQRQPGIGSTAAINSAT